VLGHARESIQTGRRVNSADRFASARAATVFFGLQSGAFLRHARSMPFSHARTVRFADTDAAGVVFFARYLAMCHEAYEEALAGAGLPLARFFADTGLVVPIAKSEASYLRPLECGDRLRIEVTPARLTEHSFALAFTIWKIIPAASNSAGAAVPATEKRAAVARTEHVCIDARTRERQALPPALAAWVDAG
jgi:1,4-dihydroxy-2-naphthoyl-CoA hydrolase